MRLPTIPDRTGGAGKARDVRVGEVMNGTGSGRVAQGRRLVMLAVSLSAVAGAWLLAASPMPQAVAAAGQAGGPEVAVVTVGQDRVASLSEWDGTLEAVREATLSAQSQGRVVKLHVQAGDRVRAGQVLAEIDAREVTLALSRDRAQLGESQATLAEARAAHARSRELRDQGFISQAALDSSTAALKVAEARQRQAQAGLGLSGVAVEHAAVRAPWDGVVTSVPVQVGDLAMPGRALFVVHAPDQLRAVAFLPNSRVAEATAARRAWVRLDREAGAAEPVAATEILAIPSSDAASGTTEIRLALPEKLAAGAGWLPGRHVRVAFEAAEAGQALLVPRASLLLRGELVGVYVATESGFVLRAVRPGQGVGDSVTILSGLREGERVALDPVRAGLAGARPVAR
jgi:RND family efflux transporter MFP subunit